MFNDMKSQLDKETKKKKMAPMLPLPIGEKKKLAALRKQ
jgi:hypothetical protein